MRGDNGLRGESGRVARRVQALLAERERPADEHDSVAAWLDAAPGVAGYGDDATASEDAPDVPAAPGRRPERAGGWRRVAAHLPVRIDPGRRGAIAVGVAVLVAAVLTGFWLVSSRPDAAPVADSAAASAPPLVSAGSTATAPARPIAPVSGSSGSTAGGVVVVDVAGKVRRPGLYRLPAGSRVDDALKAAGGARPGVDLSSLNLAALLVDGQQIAVGRPGAAQPGGGGPTVPTGTGGTGVAAGPGQPVNLNTATLEQLESLPGIGPALGQRILDYRTEHGSFASVEQLDEVSGIGPATFAKLKPLVTV